MNKTIYMDNAATTRVLPEVFEEMKPYFLEQYGNPSSVYSFVNDAKKVVDQARATISDFINAKPQEIYFTAGGSESDNWALKATAEAYILLHRRLSIMQFFIHVNILKEEGLK